MLQSIILGISSFFIMESLLGILNEANEIIKKRIEIIKNLNKVVNLDEDIMDLSFHDRIVKPIVDNMVRSVAMFIPVKEDSQSKLAEKLKLAGIRMNARDYMAMNIIIIVSLTALGFLIGTKQRGLLEPIKYGALGLIFGYVFRTYSLEAKVTERKKQIKSQLPEVMDILSVSVVAGLSFDQALGYVIEKADGPLIDEFAIARREITLGKARKEALNGVADRTQVADVKSFVSAINQADELGISMQNVLNSQSKMIRDSHRQEVEERAAKIPVKILIPMVLFIFPVIFIILLGPAVPNLMEALGNV